MVYRGTITGTHGGNFMGIPPTGKAIAFEEIQILRVADGRFVEDWGLFDMLGLLIRLGAIPAPGA